MQYISEQQIFSHISVQTVISISRQRMVETQLTVTMAQGYSVSMKPVLRIRISLMRMRIRIFLVTLMRIRIRILPFSLMRIRNPYPDSRFQVKAQNLEKVLKQAHIPYILACHLQIDADPDPDPDPAYHFDVDPDSAYHFDANPDPDPTFQFDADPKHCIGSTLTSRPSKCAVQIRPFLNRFVWCLAVLRIHDILVWIRIRGSMPLTDGCGSGFGSGCGSGCGCGSFYFHH